MKEKNNFIRIKKRLYYGIILTRMKKLLFEIENKIKEYKK